MADGRHFKNRYLSCMKDIQFRNNEKSSAFDEILYTAADFELDERHVIKK